jgi:hypothetical protein
MPMSSFIQKYEPHVTGVVSGFDRLVFRGTLRLLAGSGGMLYCLHQVGVLLKEFGTWAEAATARLKEASLQAARELDRPVLYLPSSQVRKEEVARELAVRDGIREGLVGVLTCVEPCQSYQVRRDREAKKLVLTPWLRKGLCLYHYWMDRDFGLMHARIHSWLPFPIQVCVNGREWLARRLDREGIAYRKEDNTFPWIADVGRAQEVLEELRRWPWETFLEGLGAGVNPVRGELFEKCPVEYYWTVHQSEWATDVMLDARATVEQLYPLLTRGAMEAFSCEQVMRFLGRPLTARFQGELVSDHRRREEGVRVKHQVGANSVKVYDKGSVLRVETTLNDPRDFRVYRPSGSDPEGEKQWRRLRKSVADLSRRAECSQASNDRYLEALGALHTERQVREVVAPVCRAKRWQGRRVRALRPWSEPDRRLLEVINDGAFCVNGLRHREVLERLYPKGFGDDAQRRRAQGRVSRMLRLLRAHAILAKVPRTYRYRVTAKGRQILTAILQYQALSLAELTAQAA